jgi:hypothetical protein
MSTEKLNKIKEIVGILQHSFDIYEKSDVEQQRKMSERMKEMFGGEQGKHGTLESGTSTITKGLKNLTDAQFDELFEKIQKIIAGTTRRGEEQLKILSVFQTISNASKELKEDRTIEEGIKNIQLGEWRPRYVRVPRAGAMQNLQTQNSPSLNDLATKKSDTETKQDPSKKGDEKPDSKNKI